MHYLSWIAVASLLVATSAFAVEAPKQLDSSLPLSASAIASHRTSAATVSTHPTGQRRRGLGYGAGFEARQQAGRPRQRR